MIIHLNAVENHLSNLTPGKVVRKGAVNYYEIMVSFSEDWDGLSKIVAIKSPEDSVFSSAYMLLSGRALIPWEKVEAASAAKETDDFATLQAVVYGCSYVGEDDGGEKINVRIVTNAVEINVDKPEFKGDFYEGLKDEETVNIDVAIQTLNEYAEKIAGYEAFLTALQAEFEKAEGERKNVFDSNEQSRQDIFETNEENRQAEFEEMESHYDKWEEYRPGYGYTRGNKVAYNGNSYVCVTDNDTYTFDSPENSKVWLLIAAKGERGDDGRDGDVSYKGSIGENWIITSNDESINGKKVFDFGAEEEDLLPNKFPQACDMMAGWIFTVTADLISNKLWVDKEQTAGIESLELHKGEVVMVIDSDVSYYLAWKSLTSLNSAVGTISSDKIYDEPDDKVELQGSSTVYYGVASTSPTTEEEITAMEQTERQDNTCTVTIPPGRFCIACKSKIVRIRDKNMLDNTDAFAHSVVGEYNVYIFAHICTKEQEFTLYFE